eukprot:10985723-Alexandrium_andersonii.AAC.1
MPESKIGLQMPRPECKHDRDKSWAEGWNGVTVRMDIAHVHRLTLLRQERKTWKWQMSEHWWCKDTKTERLAQIGTRL